MSLLTHLAQVPDYRRPGGNFRHPLLSILVSSVLAVLSGADNVEEMAVFGQQKQAVLARHLDLPNGVPTAETFRRVFEHLDAAAFNAAFLRWVRALLPAPVAAQICVDGQTLRGSGPQALHVVSALARVEGLCLAQVATAGKGHELAAIPDVLALLDLSGGAVVSLDALGCQPAIAGQIVDQGGHYLLALKRNQPGLWAEAARALEGVAAQHQATGWASHNRPVRWQVAVQADLRWVDEAGRWPGLAALVRVDTTRYPADGPAQLQPARYYLRRQAGRRTGAGGRARALGRGKPAALAPGRDPGPGCPPPAPAASRRKSGPGPQDGPEPAAGRYHGGKFEGKTQALRLERPLPGGPARPNC